MTYNEVLSWMFTQLPMYQQKGVIAHSGKLDAIIEFSSHLSNPEKRFKSIHVAGTNGKGSSSHMLASILQEAGYKVGLYTSPHLKDFRERIKINGKPIGKKQVINFIDNNLTYLKENKLSFFEMTVGMAFDYFATKKVDIAIIEVGLGGRLDSTNIIIPEVSLITNIGLDHVEMLGDTLSKIAVEKAGIIKQNVPVVISETQTETKEIFISIAKGKKATIVFADEQIKDVYKTSMLGDYQSKNVKGVIGVFGLLENFKVNQDHIKAGLLNVVENTGLLGRWQTMAVNPLIVCDTAHNADGLKIVMSQLQNQKYETLHMVVGFVKGKDLEAIFPFFPKNAKYYFCSPNIERGLSANLLKDKAMEFSLIGDVYSSVNKALRMAKRLAKPEDVVFIGGSTFVVAEVV